MNKKCYLKRLFRKNSSSFTRGRWLHLPRVDYPIQVCVNLRTNMDDPTVSVSVWPQIEMQATLEKVRAATPVVRAFVSDISNVSNNLLAIPVRLTEENPAA